MGVPPGNRPALPRGSEAYLNGTSQGSTSEDARLPARRAYSSERRKAISVVAASDSWNILAKHISKYKAELESVRIIALAISKVAQ